MQTQSITIKIPWAIVQTMRLPKKKIKDYLVNDIATSLYSQGILSFGKARQLCKMSKWEFQRELGSRKIERHYEEKDLDEDIEFAYSHK